MENKEHIDRLYQEKFKDFEVTPNPKVWKNIEASLQKKKRRVLPFWWFSGGAVATLIIGLLIFPFSSDKQPNKPNSEEIIITETDEEVLPTKSVKKPVIIEETRKLNTNTIVTTKTPSKKIIEEQLNVEVSKNKNQEKSKVFTTTEVAIVTEKNTTEKEQITPNKNKNLINKENRLKSEQEEAITKNNKKPDTKLTKQPISQKTKELVALNEEEVEEKPQKKWSVTPSVAFLNSGSFNNNSPISSSLNNNSVSGENTYSYGVKLGYKINEKWELQSGIHLQEVEFSTQNVTLLASTINTNYNINLIGNDELYFVSDPNNPDTSSTSDVLVDNATIKQSFGYIEIPIEVKYTLMKKAKFSTQVVTGISSLILSKNEVGASNGNSSGFIGETTNLNTLNFSGNIGLDINYQLLDKLQLNVNPMFKQQFNTFSKNTKGFKPYSIGIYTGVKYEF